jgi:hypothetical protein
MIKIVIPLVCCIALFGCDSGPKLANLCKSEPRMCKEFKEDSWCKKERKTTLFAAVSLKRSDNDQDKHDLLIAYERYAECVKFSAQIEHIKLKQNKTDRVANYVNLQKRISALSDDTTDSNHPSLLFYHWTRHANKEALKKFLAMEGSAILETSSAQFNLATHYIKRDTDKTLNLLFHALELHQIGEKINTEIFKSLTTIFIDKKKYKLAYIWLRVLRLYDDESKRVKEVTLRNLSETYELDTELLDKVAESTLKKIESNSFKAPKH